MMSDDEGGWSGSQGMMSNQLRGLLQYITRLKCALGLHNWVYGSSKLVKGERLRSCPNCPAKEFAIYDMCYGNTLWQPQWIDDSQQVSKISEVNAVEVTITKTLTGPWLDLDDMQIMIACHQDIEEFLDDAAWNFKRVTLEDEK